MLSKLKAWWLWKRGFCPACKRLTFCVLCNLCGKCCLVFSVQSYYICSSCLNNRCITVPSCCVCCAVNDHLTLWKRWLEHNKKEKLKNNSIKVFHLIKSKVIQKDGIIDAVIDTN